MTETTNRPIVKIQFIDGTTKTISFESSPDQRLRLSSRIHDLLNQNAIAFQLDGKLTVFPTSQIKSLEFSPFTDSHPNGVLLNARLEEVG